MPVRLAALALLLTLGACAGSRAPAPSVASANPESGLGTALSGETCQGILNKDRAPGEPVQIEIRCGSTTRAAAVLFASPIAAGMPAAGPERREALERAAGASAIGHSLAGEMACSSGTWSEGDGLEFLIAPCTLTSGGWPQVIVVASSGRTMFQGAGIPAAFPPLVRAIQQVNGGADRMTNDTARQLLAAAIGDQLALFESGAIDRYQDLIKVARLYNSTRDYAHAENAFRRALEIQTRIIGSNAVGVGQTLLGLALVVSAQARFDEAAGLFRRAAPLIDKSPDPGDRARQSLYLAFDAAHRQQSEEALRYARRSSEMRRAQLASLQGDELGSFWGGSRGSVRGELAYSLNMEASAALRLSDLASAEAAGTEALQLIIDTPGLPPWWRPDAQSTMGEIYARQGKLADAERFFKAALIQRQRIFGESAPTAVTYLSLGRIFASQRLYSESVRSYRLAFAIIERDAVARADVTVDQVAPFLEAAAAVAARNPGERETLDREIFKAVQLVNGGVADQTIARSSTRLSTDDEVLSSLLRDHQEAQRKRDSLRLDIARETSLADAERSAEREAALRTALVEAVRATDQLGAKLRATFPEFVDLTGLRTVELAQVQALLGPREAIVLFAFGRNSSFAVLARADRTVAHRLELTSAALEESVADLRRSVGLRAGSVADFELRQAHLLYRQTLAGFEAELRDVDHLVAVQGGALGSLPLGLLVTAAPIDKDYRHAAWLLRRHAVSQVPSIRAFAALRGAAKPRTAARPLLAIGNPVFQGSRDGSGVDALAGRCRDDGPIPPEILRALAPLPETAGEVENVVRVLGATSDSVLLGADATETSLRAHDLSQYRILYFATHGLLPGELRCQSEPALALSPPVNAAQKKDEDGLLDASEIAFLRLNAELVVLSACNTAAGGGKFGGEALSGLAEAFFHAGARRLLASHWQVPSAATVELMTRVFENGGGAAGDGYAVRLRQAQRQLMDNPATAHPFFWAAFSLIGDGGSPVAISGGPDGARIAAR